MISPSFISLKPSFPAPRTLPVLALHSCVFWEQDPRGLKNLYGHIIHPGHLEHHLASRKGNTSSPNPQNITALPHLCHGEQEKETKCYHQEKSPSVSTSRAAVACGSLHVSVVPGCARSSSLRVCMVKTVRAKPHSSCRRAPSRLNTPVFQKASLILELSLCPGACSSSCGTAGIALVSPHITLKLHRGRSPCAFPSAKAPLSPCLQTHLNYYPTLR